MKGKIGVIINYCTYDYHLIRHSISQVSKFASQIIVTYTDHFYNGKPENLSLIRKTIKENPGVKFVRIKYKLIKAPIPEFLCKLIPRSTNLRPLYGPHYWACMARYIGYQHISKDMDYFLFLDSDEVVDGRKFKQWLKTDEYKKYGAMYFSCYFYFRSPRYQAVTYEGCGLLVKNESFERKLFLSHNDRWNIYGKVKGKKKKFILGTDGKPMIHHYAWARNEKNMIEKVTTWGHSQEKDWVKMVEKEFNHKFKDTDFIRGYQYQKVKPFIKFN